ncbi:hypothetical protein D3C78_748110 [compost metagenome]
MFQHPRLLPAQSPGQRTQGGRHVILELFGLQRCLVEAPLQGTEVLASTGWHGPALLRQLVEERQFVSEQAVDEIRIAPLPTLGNHQLLVAQHSKPGGEQHQLIAQQLHQAVGAAQVWRIEIQVAAKALQSADFAKDLHLSLAEGGRRFLATDGRRSMAGHQFDQIVDLGKVTTSHRLRPGTEQTHYAHTGHRQQGFSNPGDGQHQGIVLLRNRQHGHHHGGEATEHKGVRTGVAQQGTPGGTQG